MVSFGKQFYIPIGKSGSQGKFRLYRFAGDTVALTVDGRTERTPTVLLSIEQARELQNALAELIVNCEAAEIQEERVA